MSTQVAGVLIDPFERPLANTIIDIRTINNNFALLPGPTVVVQTNAQGEYNFILEPASYAISVQLDGRSVYQGAVTVTSTTAPGTLPELLKQAQMEAELPLNYAEYFQQVQSTVKSDADRAESAAESIGDELERAEQAAASSQQSAESSEQSNQQSQSAAQSAQAIADKFQNLDDAVAQTQQNAEQTKQDVIQTGADRAAVADDANRAELAAQNAGNAISQSIRVPANETIPELGDADERKNKFVSFDNTGKPYLIPSNTIANLDGGGKIPMSQIPATVINETFAVSSQADMLALDAQQGDVAARTDLNQSYILKSSPASLLSNWVPLLSNPVFSVNGKVGQVVISDTDIDTVTGIKQSVLNKSLNDALKPLAVNLYVDAVNGVDTNAGTQASPFRTIQAAVNSLYSKTVKSAVTINLSAGTHSSFSMSGYLSGPAGFILEIVGDTANPNNYIILGSGSDAVSVSNYARLKLSGLQVKTVTSGQGIHASSYSRIILNGVNFGAVASQAHKLADTGGQIETIANYSILAPSANFHAWARNPGSMIKENNVVCAISGTPAFSWFIYNAESAYMDFEGWSYTGSTTGGRYVVTSNSVMVAGTTNATQRDNFFPGTNGVAPNPVDQPNVGGKFDGYPDYGATVLQTINASGLSSIEFDKIPDCFNMLQIFWQGLDLSNVGALFDIQFKPVNNSDYNTNANFYQGHEIVDQSTIRRLSRASVIQCNAKINGGGAGYGCIIIQYPHGYGFPKITGHYTDGSNLFHTVESVFLDPNWIRTLRLLASTGTFTAGTVKLVAAY